MTSTQASAGDERLSPPDAPATTTTRTEEDVSAAVSPPGGDEAREEQEVSHAAQAVTHETPRTILTPLPTPRVAIVSLTCSQDGSALIAATTRGFRVFGLHPFAETLRRESYNDLSEALKEGALSWTEGGCRIVRALCRAPVFAVVTIKEPKKVKIWDENKERFVGELRSRQAIVDVSMERDVVCLVTAQKVYVYLSEQMTPFAVLPTAANPKGLCFVWSSPTERGAWRLACPATTPGYVRIQDSTDTEPRAAQLAFGAHESPLSAISISHSGNLIATAGSLGTVVRIFAIVSRRVHLTHELRRGTQPCTITCLAFRKDAEFLAVSSNSRTVHIFQLSTSSEIQGSRTISCSPSAKSDEDHEASLGTGPQGSAVPAMKGGVEALATNVPHVAAGAASAVRSFLETSSWVSAARGAWDKTTIGQAVSDKSTKIAEFASAQMSTGFVKEGKHRIQGALKDAFPRYFSADRSCAQFVIPEEHRPLPDVKAPSEESGCPPGTSGPLVAFGTGTSMLVIHWNGHLYETHVPESAGNDRAPAVCTTKKDTVWFCPREPLAKPESRNEQIVEQSWEVLK